ncbi:protein translocase subunit SecF [Patescibacteria group bacterium]
MNILGRIKLWIAIAIVNILISVAVFGLWGLNTSIDFRGGSLLEINMNPKAKIGDIEKSLSDLNLKNLDITPSEENNYILRTAEINEHKKDQIIDNLTEKFSESEILENRFETIGPTVSRDLTQKALWAILIASLAIILYITWSFRNIPKPASSWKFGIAAIITLLHDAIIVIGVFVILGRFFNIEIDSLFITAVLTVIGYSVNDTIVVFDRIRENLIKRSEIDFKTIANTAVVETLSRSLNTGLTTLMVLFALFLLGGATIKYFVLALIIGIISGTYSSIFIAAPILVMWHRRT